MKNEVLLKFLCHNIVVVHQAIIELGIEAVLADERRAARRDPHAAATKRGIVQQKPLQLPGFCCNAIARGGAKPESLVWPIANRIGAPTGRPSPPRVAPLGLRSWCRGMGARGSGASAPLATAGRPVGATNRSRLSAGSAEAGTAVRRLPFTHPTHFAHLICTTTPGPAGIPNSALRIPLPTNVHPPAPPPAPAAPGALHVRGAVPGRTAAPVPPGVAPARRDARDLARPGDFLTFDLLETPILLRNFDGELRAFLNVCPHRHSRLTDKPRGNAEKLRCQYHGWEFNADGRHRARSRTRRRSARGTATTPASGGSASTPAATSCSST